MQYAGFHKQKLYMRSIFPCKLYKRKLRGSFLFFLSIFLIIGLVMSGCASKAEGKSSEKKGDPRNPTAQVLPTEASGEVTYGNDLVTLDVSHSADGYIMVCYNGDNEKVKLQITSPDGTEYTYPVTILDDYAVYPLPGENGSYKVTLLESVSVDDNLYAVSFTQDLDVQIADEFAPFLHPNYYVNFTADSECVKKGESLAKKECYSDLDVVTQIYNYVIGNISYDEKKAEDVPYGYTPDPDETLDTGKGICFDYASLMSAMLRSQRIPTKLEVGYSGEVYHAWISCYVDEIGWVDDIIQFDGKNWSIMDPTLAANNSASDVKKYVGNGKNYVTKYTY